MGTRHLGTVVTGPRLLRHLGTVVMGSRLLDHARGESCECGGGNLFTLDLEIKA
jgi:hypothetical protein